LQRVEGTSFKQVQVLPSRALFMADSLLFYNTIKNNAVEEHHNLKSDCHGASPNFQDLQQPIKKYSNNSKR
jgi:hypothetical protein